MNFISDRFDSEHFVATGKNRGAARINLFRQPRPSGGFTMDSCEISPLLA